MGKSSSQVVGYRYYAKFAAFIGNRIEKLIAINFDNRGWHVRRPGEPEPNLAVSAPNLYGENEGGVVGVIDVFIGHPDQQPSEAYQQYLPLVSGYPYQSYLVFRSGANNGGFYLGNSGYMKEMLLWVKRTRVRNDGRGQWYGVRGDGAVVCEIGAYDSKDPITIENPLFAPWLYETKTYKNNEIIFNYTDSGSKSLNKLPQELFKVTGSGADSAGNTRNDITLSAFLNAKLPYDVVFKINFEIIVSGIDRFFGVTKGEVLSEKYDFIEDLPINNALNNEGVRKKYSAEIIVSTKFFNEFEFNVKAIGAHPYQYYTGVDVVYAIQASMLNVVFEVYSNKIQSPFSNGAYDINPIHKIREILTDDTAMGKPESDVSDANFMKAADRIYDEGLGISWAIDEKSCIDAIEELCYHIEAGIRVNRQTGLYEMVLFRDDWFAEDEIHTITENKIKDLSLEVMNSDDIVNQLNVTYYDRQRIKNSTFSVYENGSILTMGHANAESVEFPYFMNMRNAEIVANWKLKQFSTPAWSGSFTTGWKEARKWNRYDLIRLPWSKKWEGTILVRIMKINLGNGTDNTVTIDFEEVIPYSGEMNTSIVVDAPVDSGPQPPQPSANTIFEAPYYLTVLRAGQTNTDLELSNNPDIGYVAAIAAKPQNNSLNALLYTDGGVGEFEQVSRLDYCDILQLDQPIIETTSSFTVTGSLTQIANSNNLILLNDELMGFVSFDDATKVLTVKRGVLDTVPKKHSSGSLFVFDLPDVAFDSTQYAQSEVVEAQVLTTTPSGVQELTAGTEVEIQARAIRPYPPANVKINGEYWLEEIETDFIITWVDRNRLQQTGGTPLSWFDNGVAIEPGTQTHLILTQLDGNQIELATSNANVTGATSYTMPISAMQADTRFVKITLKTLRDGYECLQPFEYTVELSQFFSAPYNLTVEYRND